MPAVAQQLGGGGSGCAASGRSIVDALLDWLLDAVPTPPPLQASCAAPTVPTTTWMRWNPRTHWHSTAMAAPCFAASAAACYVRSVWSGPAGGLSLAQLGGWDGQCAAQHMVMACSAEAPYATSCLAKRLSGFKSLCCADAQPAGTAPPSWLTKRVAMACQVRRGCGWRSNYDVGRGCQTGLCSRCCRLGCSPLSCRPMVTR